MNSDGRNVLIVAPFRGDSSTLRKMLEGRYHVHVCRDIRALTLEIGPDTGLILMTEEALVGETVTLGDALARQPSWSDVPILLLASSRSRAGKDNDAARRRLPRNAGNVVVLERPMSSSSLLSAIASAWQSRERQFDLRDRMAELAEERERFRILLANIPVGVSFVDKDGAALVSNPLYERYAPSIDKAAGLGSDCTNWSLVDAEGNPIALSTHPAARALNGELVEGAELCQQLSPTLTRWISVSAVPLRGASSEIIGAALVVVDINDQKQAELSLRQFNDSLEIQVAARTTALATAIDQLQAESSERERTEEKLRHSLKMEAVGQLTGGIAHDFNNMLMGVLGALDLINLRLAKGNLAGVDKFLDAAQVSARRAAALTQRLLAFSRRQSLDTKPLSVNELVTSLQDLLMRSVTEQTRVVLQLCDSSPWTSADANQLENAVLNLVINARDAMPHGGTITVSTALMVVGEKSEDAESLKPGDYVRIDVRDTGVGIPPAIISKVIEPFFTTKPQGQGTGLGLSMVYGFAKQSHGRLGIASVPNEGTTMSIFLPSVEPGASQESMSKTGAAEGTGQLILLVEDDDSVRMLNEEVLLELGYNVLIAADAQQALITLEALPRLELLITDVGLPGMNGRQLAEVAQQKWPDLPVLFLTGYAEGATTRADFLGTNMYLMTKPFELPELAERVGAMLEASSLEKQ